MDIKEQWEIFKGITTGTVNEMCDIFSDINN